MCSIRKKLKEFADLSYIQRPAGFINNLSLCRGRSVERLNDSYIKFRSFDHRDTKQSVWSMLGTDTEEITFSMLQEGHINDKHYVMCAKYKYVLINSFFLYEQPIVLGMEVKRIKTDIDIFLEE